jgi:hypothetical protein
MAPRLHAAVTKVARTLRHPVQELSAAALIGAGVGFAGGTALVLTLHFTHALPAPGQRQVAPFSAVPADQAAPLAERFRPWLRFDSGEAWQPLNVDSVLDEHTQRLCRSRGNTDCVGVPNHLAFDTLVGQTSGLGAHLNLNGSDVKQYHGPQTCAPPLLDCGTGPSSAIYYHATQSYDRFYIDYWWFLRDNHLAISRRLCFSSDLQKAGVCDEHEGDWEGVTVVTPPDDPNHVAYVVYAAHKGAFRYAATSLQMVGANKTRPVVYVANGSHAAYPIECHDRQCFQPVGLAVGGLFDVPEGRYDGQRSWPRNANDQCNLNGPGSCLLTLSEQPWTNWPGQWGDGCESACGGVSEVNSPQSPGLQSRYQTPWCSTETIGITCDGRVVTCSDWLGPLLQAVVCDPATLSKGLRSSNAIAAGQLGLIVGAKQIAHATTPGVVQALGRPFAPGSTFTAIADGPASQLLVRAQDHGIVVEDRFANLDARPGQRIQVTITAGTDRPLVRANAQPPVEQRILESAH